MGTGTKCLYIRIGYIIHAQCHEEVFQTACSLVAAENNIQAIVSLFRYIHNERHHGITCFAQFLAPCQRIKALAVSVGASGIPHAANLLAISGFVAFNIAIEPVNRIGLGLQTGGNITGDGNRCGHRAFCGASVSVAQDVGYLDIQFLVIGRAAELDGNQYITAGDTGKAGIRPFNQHGHRAVVITACFCAGITRGIGGGLRNEGNT